MLRQGSCWGAVDPRSVETLQVLAQTQASFASSFAIQHCGSRSKVWAAFRVVSSSHSIRAKVGKLITYNVLPVWMFVWLLIWSSISSPCRFTCTGTLVSHFLLSHQDIVQTDVMAFSILFPLGDAPDVPQPA